MALSLFASLVMGVSLMMTKSRSGIACLAVALVLTGVMVLRKQKRASIRGALVVAMSILLLGVVSWAGVDTMLEKFRTPDRGLVGAAARLSAWQDTLRIVRDSPLTGLGFDTYGTAMVVYQSSPRDMHFQEAHNDYLQLAAEGGLLLVLPACAAIAFFIRDIRRRFREAPREGMTYWLRVGAVIGLVAIALQSIVEFSLQMPGNAALFALLAAVALHRSPHLMSRPATHPPRPLALVPDA
jgi:O-antigen ligase